MDKDGTAPPPVGSSPVSRTANDKAKARSSSGGLRLVLIFALLCLLVGTCAYLALSMTPLAIAEMIATPGFILFYSLVLLAITLGVIFRTERQLARERSFTDQLIATIDGASNPDQRLRLLNRTTDARITSVPSCRDDVLSPDERATIPKSGILRAASALLGMITSVPADKHSLEGLRPADGILQLELRRYSPRLAGVADFVIRLALLGTFIGLIAALTIAGAKVGHVQPTEEAQSAYMRDFIQKLLASAATKFWISAIGIACALVLRGWQARVDRQFSDMASKLGLSFDLVLAQPDVARAWCPTTPSNIDPVSGFMDDVAAQLKARTNDLVISFAPGRTSTSSRTD